MTVSLPYPPPWQDISTLCEHICAGESTIEGWVKMGLFPAPRKIGGKRLWQWKEVERHLAALGDAVASSHDPLAERIRNATRQAASGQD
jgi:predicted DNA-binding transcriptional regulator AlpA